MGWEDPISPKQVGMIKRLREERGVTDVMSDDELSVLTRRQASAEIDRLFALPKAPAVQRAEEAHVEPGCYAIEYDGVLRFYRVKEGQGRFAGRLFINRYASDYYARITHVERREAKALIAEDPHTAKLRFARELGRCYVCARTLTDEESRRQGIGPVCRGA